MSRQSRTCPPTAGDRSRRLSSRTVTRTRLTYTRLLFRASPGRFRSEASDVSQGDACRLVPPTTSTPRHATISCCQVSPRTSTARVRARMAATMPSPAARPRSRCHRATQCAPLPPHACRPAPPASPTRSRASSALLWSVIRTFPSGSGIRSAPTSALSTLPLSPLPMLHLSSLTPRRSHLPARPPPLVSL